MQLDSDLRTLSANVESVRAEYVVVEAQDQDVPSTVFLSVMKAFLEKALPDTERLRESIHTQKVNLRSLLRKYGQPLCEDNALLNVMKTVSKFSREFTAAHEQNVAFDEAQARKLEERERKKPGTALRAPKDGNLFNAFAQASSQSQDDIIGQVCRCMLHPSNILILSWGTFRPHFL